MEKKQTAVDWLFLMMNNPNKDQEFSNKLLDKAKQMEKEQMKNVYLTHITKAERLRKIFEQQFEDFYKETYGGQDEK